MKTSRPYSCVGGHRQLCRKIRLGSGKFGYASSSMDSIVELHKSQGNKHFQNSNYGEAISCYTGVCFSSPFKLTSPSRP
jgi:hypothetical protein